VSYTVLARRYRSRDFDEIVGQEPIARTLRNAIDANRTAHAYLFCGTRGVGKTSMARIFAKALEITDDLDQPEAIADAILRGDDLDVIEIDGASNRGIQEAKDLIAGAGLSPTRCRYKIYIIDEVHALTRDAFNALLKTMEEPPAHVKFILCTTDPMKVPATIQSRCQRFDFRPIPTPVITEHLTRILEQEAIEVEPALVSRVARLGAGSMRDALSLLDRLIASGEKSLTLAAAEPLLGLPDGTLVGRVVEAITAGDAAAGLNAGADLLAQGSTVEQAMEMLTDHFRTLMLASACGADSALLELPDEAARQAADEAAHFDLPRLVYLIALCDSVTRNARGSATARALFDAAIVRMCLSDRLADVTEVLAGSSGRAAPPERKPRTASERTTAKKPVGKKKGDAPPVTPPAPPGPAGDGPDTVVEVKRTPAPAPDPAATADEVEDERLWTAVLEVAATSPKDQAKVRHLDYRSFDGTTLHLAVSAGGSRSARFLGTQTESLRELVERATGRRVRIAIETPPAPAAPEAAAAAPARVEAATREPLVKKAMELFDGTIIDVTETGSTEEGKETNDV
jgi:DNA polymerase-3 subunit gamma/tau